MVQKSRGAEVSVANLGENCITTVLHKPNVDLCCMHTDTVIGFVDEI